MAWPPPGTSTTAAWPSPSAWRLTRAATGARPLANWQIVQAMHLPTFPATPESVRQSPAGLIIDALFGTGLTEAPRDPFRPIVEAIEALGRAVVAVDLPSGLDCDTGRPLGACIRATRTVTFVAEKAGFANPDARQWLGEVTVGDIGCPKELVEEIYRGNGTA